MAMYKKGPILKNIKIGPPEFFGKWGQEIKRGGGPLNIFKIGSRQFLKNSW
jgi:hypothetical protein